MEAVNEKEELFIYLVGQEAAIQKELEQYTYPKDRIQVVAAEEVIETGEPPVQAIQKKKDSSMVKALRVVRSQGEASALCLLRKYGSRFSRRSGSGREDQRCGASCRWRR